MSTATTRLDRAQGCLLGQLAGDSLGSLVEFQTPAQILQRYPRGVRELADSDSRLTLAGQPTDDSEMALSLAHSLVDKRGFDPEAIREAYVSWLDSEPFDCGKTVASALRGNPDIHSQANGALMRISPLGIFGVTHDRDTVMDWARQDALITHRHPVCVQANALYVDAVRLAIGSQVSPHELYAHLCEQAAAMRVDSALLNATLAAGREPPADYVMHMGWVLIAWQNALWQLINAPNLEEGIIDTVMQGGDSDTNAAICGALLGAVYGRQAIPAQWEQAIRQCEPLAGARNVKRPRPQRFWPSRALELAAQLLGQR